MRRLVPFGLLCLSVGIGWGQVQQQLSLLTNPDPSTFGQTVTMTASLQSFVARVTITFTDVTNNTPLGSAALVQNGNGGIATFQTAGLSIGTHGIQASSSNAGILSSVIVNQVVGRTATTTSVATSITPSTYCGPVTFTATVSSSSFGSTVPAPPTGTVTFSDGASFSATGTLSNGRATASSAVLTGGNHLVQATYNGDNTYGPSSGTVGQVVNRAAASATLGSAPNPSTFGQNVAITTTVAGCTVGAAPTGTVTVFDGQNSIGQATITGGTATLQTSTLAIGTHPLDASYPGDINYLPATSNTVNQVVNAGTSTITLTGTPNPSVSGQTVTLTATVTPGSATGTVNFLDGGSPIGQGTLISGVATFQTSTLSVGSHPLTATYAGNQSVGASTSPVFTQVVNAGGSTTTLTGTPNPSVSGQTVTLTATVTPSSATGTVNFLDGATQIGQGTLISGVATLQTSTLAIGSHPLTARYAGNQTVGASTSAVFTQVVNAGSSSTSLTGTPNPSTFGTAVTLTATVTPNSATGTVNFLDNGVQIGQGTLANGVATFQTSTLSVGSHPLTASYAGNSTVGASTSPVFTQVVNAGGSTTSLTGAPNPSAPGQNVTLTATVSPSSATGNVTFQEGSTNLGQATLANGVATFQISTLSTGSHSLTATYAGNSTVGASTSAVFTQVVGKANTTTTLTPSANPIGAGLALTLTATVSPASATGQVQFRDGSTAIGTGTLSNGTATFSTTLSVSGSPHSLTAAYQGDASFNGSTSNTVSETVNSTNSTITLQVSPNPATVGATVSMSAVVQPTSATGTVSFRDGGVLLQSVNLSGGVATFNTTALTAGTHNITAQYSGDSTFQGVTSSPAILIVNSGTTNTTTTLTANPTTSPFGQGVNLTATVSPATATGNVTFFDGSATVGTGILSSGTASFSTTTLAVGTHSLLATYNGDANSNVSTSNAVTVTITQATTTTVLTINPTSSTPGQAVVMTARVTPVAATGNVTFRDGTTSLGSAALSGGTASMSVSTLSTGTHSITAVYAGDTNFTTSTSAAVSASVGLTPTTTTLATSPAAPAAGDAVTLTATVAPGGATGSVTFQEGGSTLGTGTLNGSGVATFTTSTLAGGSHSITAVYAGDSKFATSTSTAATVTVTGVVKTPTSIVLTVSPSPANAGQTVTLTGRVTPATATGTVTFLDNGGTTLGTGTLTGGVATFTISTLQSGPHSLTASYGGDTNNASSTSTAVTLTVGAVTALGNIAPTTLPAALVGVAYSQTFTVAGGTAPFTWTLAAGNAPGITMSAAGVLAGTPTTAGNFSLTIRVVDARGQATATVQTLTVVPQPAVTISVTQPAALTDQPTPQVSVPSFPSALVATFTLVFTPDSTVKGLPSGYTNPDVLFPNGSTTSAAVNIPANSTASFPVQPVQLGSVAGVISVRLATLTSGGQAMPLPNPVPSAAITVRPGPPTITSVKITGVSGTGFTVIVDATSTTRDLTSASLNFSAASGAQLNGGQQNPSLASAGAAWFIGTNNPSLTKGTGGNFAVTMPFAFSGDTSSIGNVSVTLTNSVGTSTAVSGGR